jgi:hypothetical protein
VVLASFSMLESGLPIPGGGELLEHCTSNSGLTKAKAEMADEHFVRIWKDLLDARDRGAVPQAASRKFLQRYTGGQPSSQEETCTADRERARNWARKWAKKRRGRGA